MTVPLKCPVSTVFRYELFWLPLLGKFGTLKAAAPLDIAWVWHVHMLSPLNYLRDCNEIVSTLVDHRILVGEKREQGLHKAKLLWYQLYPEEPFEVDLTAPLSNVPAFKSKIKYDIVAACSRQRVFNYQVFLPHYEDEKFLYYALGRYKWHLRLKQENPDTFLVPCYDIDLMWHAHQVHPLTYKDDTMKLLGKVLKHNDSVNDRTPGSKLSTSEKTTRQIWRTAKVAFATNGAMFRGEPPSGCNRSPEPCDYSWMAARQYTLDLTRLEVEELPKPKSYKVGIDVVNGKRVIEKRVKGPAARIHNPSKALSTFKFNTKKSKDLKVWHCSTLLLPCEERLSLGGGGGTESRVKGAGIGSSVHTTNLR